MTNHASIAAEIDAYNARQSRIDNLRNTTPEHQLKRLAEIEQKAALGLARVFGSRLDERVAAYIVDGIILQPDVRSVAV